MRAWFLRTLTLHLFERNYPAKFGLLHDFKSWILFDSWWLNIREVRGQRGHATGADLNVDFYDTLLAAPNSSPLPGEAYWPSKLMAPYKSSSAELLREENLVWFLQLLGRQDHSKAVNNHIASHLIELKSRITADTLSSFRHISGTRDVEFMDYTQEYIHYTLGKRDGNYLEHRTYGEVNFRYPVSNGLYQASVTQAYLIYDNFASTVSMIHEEHSTEDTTYNHRVSIKFLDVIARLFTHEVWISDGRISLHPTFCKTLQSISSTLQNAVSHGEKRPLLFLSTSYLINRMFKPGVKPYHKDSGYYLTRPISDIVPWVQSTPIHSLLDALINYNESFKPNRTSPFLLEQLAFEKIYLWKIESSQKLGHVLELPQEEKNDWRERRTDRNYRLSYH
ncbi:hypothetical protein GALMADRAFT_217348 [Galerina marginata CBS 339.88]|uniref:Uncharacterized protein n=1 Tax=Galerina marginata (strain CBS 339.88) TaxID=685588 RepID=A0A067SGJ8_GALM3|nr:hypothetical protein GALMADRAFT_217348 [Galerina marginata CBS 339.88]